MSLLPTLNSCKHAPKGFLLTRCFRLLSVLSLQASRRLSSYYGGYGSRRLQSASPLGRQLSSYYYGSSSRRLSSLLTAPIQGRRLASYYYGSR
jgi:hypothetical protein